MGKFIMFLAAPKQGGSQDFLNHH